MALTIMARTNQVRYRVKVFCSLFIRFLRIVGAAAAWQKRWWSSVGIGMPDFAIEDGCRGVVCGVDEVGRGPLAGPVVAAAVVIDPACFTAELRDTLDDS